MKIILNELDIMNDLSSTGIKTPYYSWETDNFILNGERPDSRVEILNKSLPSFFFKNKKVLDLGCNLGRFCHYAKDKNASDILGIEQDVNTHKGALNILNIEKANNISIINKDLRYDFSDIKDMDICLAFSVLHHINPRVELFKALNENIKASIIIEAKEKEYPFNSQPLNEEDLWIFKNKNQMINYILNNLPNFYFEKDLGFSERERYMLLFKRDKNA